MSQSKLTGFIRTKSPAAFYGWSLCFMILFGNIVYSTIIALPTSATTSLSQSYSANEKITIGSIVSLINNSNNKVAASSSNTADGILGVAINANSSLLSLTNDQDNQVQVATSGTLPVLVSNINGEIKNGDQITASPISGIGMKATSNVRVVGIAQGDLNSNNGSEQKYKDADGVEHAVIIGDIPVLVNVSYFFKEPDKTLVPPAIQNVANSLAGKQVSTLPILISAAIFIVTIVIVSSITYSMIKSSIISVGRNPMSQSAIYRDLVQMSALVLAILSLGMIAIYLVLTRM
jgi:hypothetical protein